MKPLHPAILLLLFGACNCEQVMVRDQGSTCGNGERQTDEGCDDGNRVNTDACTNGCEPATCGDGIVGPGEACDDQNDDPSDGCHECQREPCGNGVVEGEEECDDGNDDNTDDCLSSCIAASCGDGFAYLAEEDCDDGDGQDDNACRNSCVPAACGDGVVRTDLAEGDDGFEGCDDGNEVNTDNCLPRCVPARCGDGVVREDLAEGAEGFEECDDGNQDDNDDCQNDCTPPFVLANRIAAGSHLTCYISRTGRLYCWGVNSSGVLGHGTREQVNYQPTEVHGNHRFTAVAAGSGGCGVTVGGAVLCWGTNNTGQVGDGTTFIRDVPTPVAGVNMPFSPQTGSFTCMGSGPQRHVYCWGSNTSCQVGCGLDNPVLRPHRIAELQGVQMVATSHSTHACAVQQNGMVMCWGANGSGQVGQGGFSETAEPSNVLGIIAPVIDISAGGRHTCAVTEGGVVQCWGSSYTRSNCSSHNLRGIATANRCNELSPARKVAAGQYHTCVIMNDGTVRCVGNNGAGERGNGERWIVNNNAEFARLANQPASQVVGITNAVEISSQWQHTCVLMRQNDIESVRCWGTNYHGALGDGTNNETNVPVGPAELPP
jgi:cysteine-rich repeat protein